MTWTFFLDSWSAIRLAFALAAMLTVPGWLVLSITNRWERWPVLNRWLLAVAISTAFFPALFYLARLFGPGVAIGPLELRVGLAVAALAALWRLRGSWRDQVRLERLEWLALLIIAVTVLTRFWVVRDWPYPASPDTLHHALITRLTAEAGQLPTTIEPYFPISLEMYHLGMYALSATAQNLADVPPHAALLWLAQTLNGLGAIGVYLWLERRVGRLGAVVGLITAGLLSFQPALLTSWGRFTPLGSHALLFCAIWLIEEGLEGWVDPSGRRRHAIWDLSVSGLLLAGIFLIHFRVAAYLVPLLAVIVIRGAWGAHRAGRLRRYVLGVAYTGGVTFALTLPVMLELLQAYGAYVAGLQSPERQATAEIIQSTYYPFTLAWVNEAGMRYWLLALGGASAVLGLVRRQRLTQDTLLWMATLYAMGMAYVLNIPILQFTNMTAILIALYLPVGVLVGVAAEAAIALAPAAWIPRARALLLAVFLLMAANSARARATEYLVRFQFVRAEDIPAMNWIRANTPPDAVFAVNALYFHPESLYGTDAGYWIPYFTGRQTTAGSMLFTLGEETFRRNVAESSQAVKAFERGEIGIEALRERGITHIYIGRAGNFAEPGLDLAVIRALPGVRVVYEQDGVSVIDIGVEAP